MRWSLIIPLFSYFFVWTVLRWRTSSYFWFSLLLFDRNRTYHMTAFMLEETHKGTQLTESFHHLIQLLVLLHLPVKDHSLLVSLCIRPSTINEHAVTSACLHPDPPQSHSCCQWSPSASASASSPAAAPRRTLNVLWHQVDSRQTSKKDEWPPRRKHVIVSYLASPAACEVPPPPAAAAAPAAESSRWQKKQQVWSIRQESYSHW